MARSIRWAVVCLLLVALPVQAVEPQRGGPARVLQAPPPLALQLEIAGDARLQGQEAPVSLRLTAAATAQAVTVEWETPEGVAQVSPTDPEDAAEPAYSLAAGQSIALPYRVPLGECGEAILSVVARGLGPGGKLFQARARALLLDKGGALSLETPSPAPAAAAAAVAPTYWAAGDAYEPDNTYATAYVHPMVPGTLYHHGFHAPGDEDWMRFNAVKGKTYAIDAIARGCQAATQIELYGADPGTPLVGDETTLILWTAPAGGVYRVRVRHADPEGFGDATRYDLRLRVVTTSPDAYEPDGVYTQARLAALGSIYSHNFHKKDDADWCKFRAIAGRSYIVETLNRGPLSHPLLELYDTDGQTPMKLNSEYMTWTATGTGTYYVEVVNNGRFGPGSQYRLRVRTFTPVPDAYEDDDTNSQLTGIQVGQLYRHNFDVAGDVDWSKFAVQAGVTYAIEMVNGGKYAWASFYLHSYTGTLASGNPATPIVYTPPADGVLAVEVAHSAALPFGPGTQYDLRVQGPDIYEPDNDQAHAHPLALGAIYTHTLLGAGDVDYARLDAVAGKTYAFEVLGQEYSWPPTLTLFDAGAVELERVSSTRLAWRATATGPVYLRVAGSSHGAGTGYSLRVRTITALPDAYEPDNNPAHARPVSLGTIYRHNFHAWGDADWSRFYARAGKSYAIQLLNLGPEVRPFLRVDDPRDNTLLSGLWNPNLSFTARETGIYRILVVNCNDPFCESNPFGPGTQYSLRVRAFTPTPDENEPDDDAASARTYGTGQLHNFHLTTDDVDWVEFSAAKDVTYTIETVNLGCRADTRMQLYDTDATHSLGTDDDSGWGRASRIVFPCHTAGSYYVAVRPSTGSGLGLGPTAYGPGTQYQIWIH